jgi:hypothetical protein
MRLPQLGRALNQGLNYLGRDSKLVHIHDFFGANIIRDGRIFYVTNDVVLADALFKHAYRLDQSIR